MFMVAECEAVADRRGAVLASNIWLAGSVPFADWYRGVQDWFEGPETAEPPGLRVQLSTGEHGPSIEELDQFIEYTRALGTGGVVMVDEIGILMPARFWQAFPVDLMQKLSQSRKYRIDFFYSSQDIEDVDSYLRRKTSHVYRMRSFPTPTIDRQERGKRPWFVLETRWRPGSVGKKDKRLGWRIIRYRRFREGRYDTDEIVAPARRLTSTADLCGKHKREDAEARCPLCHPRRPRLVPRDGAVAG
jgi:hypothetical protein